jgi:LacI family transcriptional regulator
VLREYLVDNDLIETIAKFPGGLLYHTSIPIYVLKISKKKQNKGFIKLMDCGESVDTDNREKRINLYQLNILLKGKRKNEFVVEVQNSDVKNNDYNLYVAYTNNSIELEKSFARSIIKLNIEGVIIGLFDKSAGTDHLSALVSHNIPTVFINNSDQNLKAVNISPDISHGSYLAVNHLISMGCKSISVLINDRKNPYYADIIEGYSSAISASDLALNEEMIYEGNLVKENIYNYLDELYENSKFPNGIISPNNYTSKHIVSWLKKKNLNIPNDLLFVGFSNDKNIPEGDISLTTVQFSGSEIGEKAAKILFEQIDKSKVMNETIIIPAKFIIKGSSLKIMN